MLTDNHIALLVYEKCGFIVQGQFKDHVAILYTADLKQKFEQHEKGLLEIRQRNGEYLHPGFSLVTKRLDPWVLVKHLKDNINSLWVKSP